MTASRDVPHKVADWLLAYTAIRDELTPEAFRVMTHIAAGQGDVQSINVGITVARVVFANDRAAATVAALLTQSGIKPTGVDYGEDLE